MRGTKKAMLMPSGGYSGDMPEGDTPILVIGGGSRIAKALMPLLGETAAYVCRRPIAGRIRDFLVDDYDTIPVDAFRDVRCIINCVGVSTGSVTELNRINVEIPRRWATAAKRAGVRHLIHISSFSVYGAATAIDRDTATSAVGDYGRSKLAADGELLALADNHFAVSILRLPLIYGEGSLGKLGQLLRWWERLRMLPVPAGDISRAMIGAELSAAVISHLCRSPQTGIVFAADPLPFTYVQAARARGGRLFRLPVPHTMTTLVERAIPALGSRLFGDSRLADTDNLAIEYGLESRLYRDIAMASLE